MAANPMIGMRPPKTAGQASVAVGITRRNHDARGLIRIFSPP